MRLAQRRNDNRSSEDDTLNDSSHAVHGVAPSVKLRSPTMGGLHRKYGSEDAHCHQLRVHAPNETEGGGGAVRTPVDSTG